MKNYPFFLFAKAYGWDLPFQMLKKSPTNKNIAKIILIKVIKFYDLISIIFKRGLFHSFAFFWNRCQKKLKFNAFEARETTKHRKKSC